MNFVTPTGFRDILPEEARRREEIIFKVQQCFAEHGYSPIETPTLEVMDVLRAGVRSPDAPFKFFDSQGDLLAMRPDVTTQIARLCATRLKDQSDPFKFRYTHRVFREADAKTQAAAREMTQLGIESIGLSGVDVDFEMIRMLAEALTICGLRDYRLVIGTVGVLRALLENSGADESWKSQVLNAYHSSNFVELDSLAKQCGSGDAIASAIAMLPRIRGKKEAICAVRELVEPLGCSDGIDAFAQTFEQLESAGFGNNILIDFSVMSSFDYYTGIVVEAYAEGFGTSIGSGGRYDTMLEAYGTTRPAAGFAFSLESVMEAFELQNEKVKLSNSEACAAPQNAPNATTQTPAINVPTSEPTQATPATAPQTPAPTQADTATAPQADTATAPQTPAPTQANTATPATAPQTLAPTQANTISAQVKRPLRIAVPKGSLNADTIRVLNQAGLDTSGLQDSGRQLIIRNPGVEYVIVRPTDAPIFVHLGAADCGICGKDSLVEADCDVVELADLEFGACRFVVAEPDGAADAVAKHYAALGSIRVATKYPGITAEYYSKAGMQVEIVKLHGNIELAPLTGMAERIVDITATGTTLKENNLIIVDEVFSSTARFFANVCAFRTDPRIVELAQIFQNQAKG